MKETWVFYKQHLILLLKLSWPNVLTSLIQLALPVISTLAVGHIESDNSTALIGAAGLANVFANATGFALGSGLSMALDTLCSQAFGAKKYLLVGLHCQRAMIILSIICFPIAVLWYYSLFILKLIGTMEIALLSQHWVRLLIIAVWPRLMYEAYRRYLLAQRIMWPLTASVVLTVPVHLAATYLLVFAFNWGYTGAALATCISYWVLFVSVVLISYIRLVVLRRKVGTTQHVRLNEQEESDGDDTLSLGSSVNSVTELIEEENTEQNGDPLHTWPSWSKDAFRGWVSFMKLGMATAASFVIESASFEVNAAIASRLGEVPLAAHSILSNCSAIWYSFPLGVASASSALVGNNLGAGEPAIAKASALIGLIVVLIYSIINGAIGLLYRNYLGAWFTNDKEVISLISSAMFVMWFYGIVDSLKAVGMAILRGSGRPKITVYGNILSCIVIGYPVAILLVMKDFGLSGLWFGIATAWLCASSIYIFVIIRTNWQTEVLNATKRNDEAANSTIKGRDLSNQGLLMSVVVTGQQEEVVDEENNEL